MWTRLIWPKKGAVSNTVMTPGYTKCKEYLDKVSNYWFLEGGLRSMSYSMRVTCPVIQ